MNCTSNTDKYKNLVSQFLKKDPEYYSNFDNVAKFILTNPLKDNAKTNTLHHLAIIYDQLHDASNGEIQKGQANAIVSLVDFINTDDKKYISTVLKTIYPEVTVKKITKANVLSEIKKLFKQKDTLTTLSYSTTSALNDIDNFLSSTSFKSQDVKTDTINEITAAYEVAIQGSPSEIALKALFDAKMKKHLRDTKFIDLSSIDLNKYEFGDEISNRVLLQLKDGTYVDSIRNEAGYFIDTVTNEVVDDSDIRGKRSLLALPLVAKNLGDGYKTILYESLILSGITIADIDTNVGLNTVRNAVGQVKIYAVPITQATDDRVAEFQNIAAAAPEYVQLANRKHETFEFAQQVAELQRNSSAVISTLYSPKHSENTFTLVGEYNGKRFNIYTLDNYAFLDSDNRTTKIDFSNTEHLELVSNTFAKMTKGAAAAESLSLDELQTLKSNYETFQMFKKAVLENAELSKSINNDNITDVSSLFHGYYDINSYNKVDDNIKLADVLEEENNLSVPLTIVTIDEAGEILSSEERNIPFILLRRADTNIFDIKNVLANNERVLFKNKQTSLNVYFKEILNNGNSIDSYGKSILTESDQRQEKLIVTFRDGKLDGRYKPILIETANNNQKTFADFISVLNATLSSTNRTFDMGKFSLNFYQIPLRNSAIDKSAVLDFKYSADTAGNFVLEIRPYSTNDRYNFIKSNRGKYNIALPEKEIVSIYKELLGQGLSGQNINDAQERFIDIIKDTVVKQLENPEQFGEEFGKKFREDFTINDKFRPDLIFFDYNNNDEITKLKLGKVRKYAGLQLDSDFGINDIQIANKNRSMTSIISPKSTPYFEKVNATLEEVQRDTEKQEEKVEAEQPKANPKPIKKSGDLHNYFSIDIGEGFDTATEQEWATEVNWLQSTYSMFGLNLVDIEDIKTLTEINPTVLGFIKDKFIYLNDTLKAKGTAYHEAFHGVFKYLMNARERQILLDSVYNNSKYDKLFTEDALNRFAQDRNYTESLERLRELQAEEILADAFQNYMIKENAPKTLLEKFFKMLSNLLKMFSRNSNVIDSTFRNIQRGKYANRQVAEIADEGNIKYLAIPGLPVIYNNSITNQVEYKNSTLDSFHESQLTGMVLYEVLNNNNTKLSFDEKFDLATKHLLDNVLDINIVTAQEETQEGKDELTEELNDLYKQYRFILGAKLQNKEVFDINLTGDENYNFMSEENDYVDSLTTDVLDNTNGQVSNDLLRKIVKKQYVTLNNLLSELEEADDTSVDSEVMQNIANQEQEVVKDVEDTADEELGEDGTEDFDNFVQKNTLESLPNQVKKFLAINMYYAPHEKYIDVKLPRVIDGATLFPILLKITSDVKPDKIIDQLINAAEIMINDGNVKAGNDIMTIYNNLKKASGLDSNNVATKNKQLYNMFVEVLHVTAMNYALFNLSFENKVDDLGDSYIAAGKISLKDKILYEDINKKKKDIVDSFLYAYNNEYTSKEYQDKIQKLVDVIGEIKTQNSILDTLTKYNDKTLKALTERLHTAMKDVGLNVPKSLIRLSLIGIETKENGQNVLLLNKTIKNHLEINENFIKSDKYLTKAFFNNVYDILKGKPAPAVLNKKFDDASKEYGAFNSILRKASEYIVKYDPTELPSVVRNAEGKLIYRYVKYTPLIYMVKNLREEGFVDFVKDDFEFNNFLNSFYGDNVLLSQLMIPNPEIAFKKKRGETAEETAARELAKRNYDKLNAFIKNFDISLYGGTQQFIDGKPLNGTSYNKLQERDMHLLDIYSFLKRDEIAVGDDVIYTYMRQYGQNETSPTNFLVSGLYEQFADSRGIIKIDGRLKIVETFKNVIGQEYERIRKEWSRRNVLKDAYDSRKYNMLRLNYNAVLNEDGTANVEKDNLRAYNFSKLPKYFENNQSIKQALIDSAKQGVPFNQVNFDELYNNNNTKKFLDTLDDYAYDQFNYAIENYAKQGIIKYVDTAEVVGVDKETNERIFKQDRGRVSITKKITSDFITDDQQIQLGFRLENLSSLYGKGTGKEAIMTYDETTNTYKYDSAFTSINLEGFLFDKVFNHMHNSLMFNQMFDADEALNVKGAVQLVKRNKRFIIAGNNFKNGFHKVATLNKLSVFLHPEYIEAGQYYSLDQINNDPFTDDTTKAVLAESFSKKEYMFDVFDGQSYSSIMHQMDGFEAIGKLSPEAIDILIAKHYRDITEREFNTLKKDKIIMNPKKTTTGSRTVYFKLSEDYIDRNDVSTLIVPSNLSDEQKDEYIANTYDQLHQIYSEIYSNRILMQNMRLNKELSGISDIALLNQRLIKEAHKYFKAKNSKKELHVLLNSMELDGVDQVLDPTASKTTTMLPIDFNQSMNQDSEYVNLEIASQLVSNEWKYNQVETSKVKNESKVSIQRKLLLPADIVHMKEIIGRDFTKEESLQYDTLLNALNRYETAMHDSAEAGFNLAKTFLRDDNNNLVVGQIYDIIRENLDAQNAPDSVKDLFKTDAKGEPIINQNLATIRKMLEYYFFSLYSKATDEKSTGTKFIHASSWGHNVTVDDNNNVIREEVIEANPDLYENNHVRPLGVSVEINSKGIKVYTIEAIVAMPYFASAEEKEFYLEKLNKFFATRIPTEDKRSMIVVKVVDFVNSAHGNTIILPQLAHYLAGSDFDIDTLYTQMYNTYEDFKGETVLYGDYSQYNTKEQGRFLEFIQYKLKDKDLRTLIKVEFDKLSESDDYKMSTAAKNLMKLYGFTEDDFQNYLEMAETDFKAVIQSYNDAYGPLFDAKHELRSGIDALQEKLRKNKSNDVARRQLHSIFTEIKEKQAEIDAVKTAKSELYDKSKRAFEFYRTLLKAEATLKVFSKYNLPTSLNAFNKKAEYRYSVRPVYQNDLLTSAMDILSNELVFKNLYSNQKASADSFKAVLTNQGIDYQNTANNVPYDHHSIAAVIASKSMSQSDKDNLGKAASMNKVVSFINLYTKVNQRNIKAENVVFKYNTPVYEEGNIVPVDYKLVEYNRYGVLDKDNNRVIQKVGDSIGMFADAGNDPLPALLGVNDANSNFILSSTALGLDDDLIFNMIRIPEFINATQSVLSSTAAITRGEAIQSLSIYRALNAEIKKLIASNPTAVDILKAQGVIPKNSGVTNFKINKENIVLEFTPSELDKNKWLNNTLSLEDLGIKVSSLQPIKKTVTKNKKVTTEITGNTITPLSEVQQKIILLQMIKEQGLQSFQLSQIASLINTIKSFKPDFNSFEFMYRNIQELKTKQLFLEDDIVDTIFSENKLWSVQYQIVNDLQEQAGKIFLERSPYFSSITNLFKSSLKDKSVIANTLTSMLSLYKFRTEYPGSRKAADEVHQLMLDIDDDNLRNAFTARYWFTHGLGEDLAELKDNHPNNKFLSFLREYKTKNVALTSDNRRITESYIGLTTKSKVAGDLANSIANDAKYLSSAEPLFMSKLFYHELARTGLLYKANSYLQFLDPVYIKNVSKFMNIFTDKLKSGEVQNFGQVIQSFIAAENKEGTYEILNNIFNTIAILGSDDIVNLKAPGLYFFENNYESQFISEEKMKLKAATPKESYEDTLRREIKLHLDGVVSGVTFGLSNNYGRPTFKASTRSNTLNFDFRKSTDGISDDLNKLIAQKFGVKYNYQTLVYDFPAFIKIDNNLFVLQSVEESQEFSKPYDSLAENFIDNIETGINTQGYKANYTKLEKNVSYSDTLNPGTLSQEESQVYRNLIATGKRTTNAVKTYVDVLYEEETPAEEVTKTGGPSAVKIFKWNRISAEIGTDADIAMRKIATGAIVEFKSDKVKSSSLTTMGQVGKDSSYGYETDRYIGTSYQGLKNGRNDYGPITMLARNGKLSGTELNPDTKAEIKIAHEQGSKFVLGDMEGVDTQFMDYLNELGATYAIYGHGRLKGISDVEISKPSKVTTSSSVETAETIYSKLGDKTQSENVILPKDVDIEADNIGMTYTTAIDFWRKIVPAAVTLFSKRKPLIVAFRGNSKKTFLENYNTGANTIGNPFDFRDETGDRKEQGVISTKKFIEWMITGNNFNNNNATEEYRQAIIKDIKSGKLKKASILYYEEKGYATHATALDYLINEYDWNQPVQASVTTTAEVLSQSPKEILVKYTPKGQDEQVYAVRGSKIINKDGIEVFKENGVDRYKIFANVAVLQKRAVVVTYDNTKYVVNDKQQILNGKTGKIMRWDANNGNTIAILKLASDKFAMNNPTGLPSIDRTSETC
jgi:hypothetical protein